MSKSRVTFNFIIKEAHITVRLQGDTQKMHMYVWYDINNSKNLDVMETSLKLSLMSLTHAFYLLVALTTSSRNGLFPKRLVYVYFLLYFNQDPDDINSL